jgi:hypothetical protein
VERIELAKGGIAREISAYFDEIHFPNLPRVPMKFLGVLVFSDTPERMPVFIAREDAEGPGGHD